MSHGPVQIFSRIKGMSRTNRIIAAVLAISVAVGAYTLYATLAAGTPTMYLQPSSSSVSSGQVLSLAIRVDTGGQGTNAVQSDLTYTSSFLEFQSIDSNGSAYAIDAQSSGGNGSVSIARGNITDVTGDALVATVKFKVIATNGSGSVTFNNSSVLLRTSDSTDILGAKVNGSYSIPGSGAGTAPPPAASTTPPPSAAGPAPKSGSSPAPAPSPAPPAAATPNPAASPTDVNNPVNPGQAQLTNTAQQAAKKPTDNNQLLIIAGVVSAVIVAGSGLALFLRSRVAVDAPSGSHFNEPRTGTQDSSPAAPTYKPGEWHDPFNQN
jgi:hypothetical protein